mgnify:CR=1 FL=1
MVVKNLLLISKTEAETLRQMFPNVEIFRTLQQKSGRGKRYVVESQRVKEALAKLRDVDVKSIVE